jgi:hypothetical protein
MPPAQQHGDGANTTVMRSRTAASRAPVQRISHLCDIEHRQSASVAEERRAGAAGRGSFAVRSMIVWLAQPTDDRDGTLGHIPVEASVMSRLRPDLDPPPYPHVADTLERVHVQEELPGEMIDDCDALAPSPSRS